MDAQLTDSPQVVSLVTIFNTTWRISTRITSAIVKLKARLKKMNVRLSKQLITSWSFFLFNIYLRRLGGLALVSPSLSLRLEHHYLATFQGQDITLYRTQPLTLAQLMPSLSQCPSQNSGSKMQVSSILGSQCPSLDSPLPHVSSGLSTQILNSLLPKQAQAFKLQDMQLSFKVWSLRKSRLFHVTLAKGEGRIQRLKSIFRGDLNHWNWCSKSRNSSKSMDLKVIFIQINLPGHLKNLRISRSMDSAS